MILPEISFADFFTGANGMMLAMVFYLNRMDFHFKQLRKEVTFLSGKPLDTLADHETRISVLEKD